jgi:hypothetical protein
MTTSKTKEDYIIEAEPNKFLVYIGGDWGPDHSLRGDSSIALGFESKLEAIDYYQKYWTGDKSRIPYAIKKRNTKIITSIHIVV